MSLIIIMILIFGYFGYKLYQAYEDNQAYIPPEGYEIDWAQMIVDSNGNKSNRQIERDMKKGLYIKKKTEYKK